MVPDDRAIDGGDIRPVLLEGKTIYGRELAYFMSGQFRSYRKGDWKIKMPYAGYKGSRGMKAVPAHDTLLFNLKTDIGEQQNLLQSEPRKKNELLEAMEVFRTRLGELPPSLLVKEAADHSHFENQKKWLEELDKKMRANRE